VIIVSILVSKEYPSERIYESVQYRLAQVKGLLRKYKNTRKEEYWRSASTLLSDINYDWNYGEGRWYRTSFPSVDRMIEDTERLVGTTLIEVSGIRASEIIQMPEKELREARRARIPEEIIAKMMQGLEITEREKDIVNKHGKVYVRAFEKDSGRTMIKPQLRDLPGFKHRRKIERKIYIPMSEKELREARKSGVPNSIIEKMTRGIELSEWEKEVVKIHYKTYVKAHKKGGR